MPDSGDFAPIVEDTVIEQRRGILGRASRRSALPPLRHGLERVFVYADGAVAAGGADLTAGERYWGQIARVVSVDVGDHVLSCGVDVHDPLASAGYVATASITVRVCDAAEVVRRNIPGVYRFMAPVVEEAVRTRLAGVRQGVVTSEVAASLHTVRLTLEQSLREDLAEPGALRVPRWLEARIESLSVAFDERTDAYVAELESAAREAQVREIERTAKLAHRASWRQELGRMLSDPLSRALEIVLEDPTPERIAEVADRMDDLERRQQGELFRILQAAMDGDFISELNPKEARAIRMVLEELSGARGGEQLEAGDDRTEPDKEIVVETDADDAKNWAND